MRIRPNLATVTAVLARAAATLGLSGCGTPAAPQPPSLNLPEPVTDLAGQRVADQITLHWTMPRKTTDRELIRGLVTARIWRTPSNAQPQVAGTVTFAPAAAATFTETLPAPLATGNLQPLLYSVELLGKRGRSAGSSQPAYLAAGQAPAPFGPLTAELRANGVALHFASAPEGAVLLHRHLASAAPKASSSLLATPAEPVDVDLNVDASTGDQGNGALDTSARFGQTYEYTAQSFSILPLASSKPSEGHVFVLFGTPSAPVRVPYADTFPPEVPQELVTVAVAAEEKSPASIDLSWQPDTESDLAGYIVYRAEAGSQWQRISPGGPLTAPAFRDTTVQAGHSYRYAVTAIDLSGNESKRSAEATETAPAAN